MSASQTGGIVRPKGWRRTLARVGLYAMLALFCLYYLAPLVVMVSTSLKSLEEIRTGTLISLPGSVGFEASRLESGILQQPWEHEGSSDPTEFL